MHTALIAGPICFLAALAQAGGDAVSPVVHHRHIAVIDPERPLATLPPAKMSWYHTRETPGVGNGRLWEGAVVTRTPGVRIEWPGPGPERYGAPNDDRSLVHARVGRAVVSFSPWVTLRPAPYGSTVNVDDPLPAAWYTRPARVSSGFSNPVQQRAIDELRHARNYWLREQGYVGGVRTFTNPVRSEGGERSGALPEPAGWFRVPADVPRTRSREQVRYSLPPGMDPAAAAALTGAREEAVARRER